MMHTLKHPRRLVIGISGASGFCYGVEALKMLRELGVEAHVVISKAAHQTRAYETQLSREDVEALAHTVYAPADIGAAIASGSFHTMGMLVAPCSVRTLGEIASGACDSLLSRAADVTLKQRRPLVLMVRETPFHLGHIRNMAAVTEYGGIIFPPVPAFYNHPQNLEEMVRYSVARALDLFGFRIENVRRWGEDS